MASAFAALRSLDFTIEQHEQRSFIFPAKLEIQSLKEKTTFLLQFFDEYHDSQISCQQVLDLEIRAKDVALAADCMIDSHAMDQVLRKHGHSGDNTSQLFPDEDIDDIFKEFDYVVEKARKIMMDVKAVQPSTTVPPSSPSRHVASITDNSTMIGFEKHLNEVMYRTKSDKATLQIVPIVGTGGAGKTMLAHNVYCNKLIKETFKYRLWSTVSQSNTVRNILLMFLQDLDESLGGGNMSAIPRSQQSDEELGQGVYKALFGRRYLIVMDDIWSVELWDKIRKSFPDNGNKSRIIITTRLGGMASHIGSRACAPYTLDVLCESQSWNLLKGKVFGENACPAALEDIGKRIATNCKGLPLAVVVIAGQLAKSTTREYWETVAKMSSILQSDDSNQCLTILSLSYNNLPIHLKLCFLYTAFCQEDSVFLVSEIIKVWVANGLVKPIIGQCLEKTAMGYLTDLVGRNLISVTKQGSTGEIKSCRIHDLLLDLCRNIASKGQIHYKGTVHGDHVLGMEINPNIRIWRAIKDESLDLFSSRFARLDNRANKWDNAAHHNLWNFRLRSIQLSASETLDDSNFSEALASVSTFQNLHNIVIKEMPGNEPVILTPQIWEMPLLRHIDIKQVILPDPSTGENGEECCVLENLQSIQNVHFFKLSEDVLKRIPNLKKLKCTYTRLSRGALGWPYYCLHNLARLSKLESLVLTMVGEVMSQPEFSLPCSLKKLSLDGCNLPWEYMKMVRSLPDLEVLRLQNDAFYGAEWILSEEDIFSRVKVLHLQNMSLEQWEVESEHFPSLERLFFYNVWRMKTMPAGIAQTTNLQILSIEFGLFSAQYSVGTLLQERKEDDGTEVKTPVTRNHKLCGLYYILRLKAETGMTAVEKFEDDLRQMHAFLNNRKDRNDHDLHKELVKKIQDVNYEVVDLFYAMMIQFNNDDFMRLSSAVLKKAEEVSKEVQEYILTLEDGGGNEVLTSYKDPVDPFDHNTNDEEYNMRIRDLINEYVSKEISQIDGVNLLSSTSETPFKLSLNSLSLLRCVTWNRR